MTDGRSWLITGVSGGLGLAVAGAVLDRGDRVVGTVRDPEQVTKFESLAAGRAFAEVLDVTAPEPEVKDAVDRAFARADGLDVVVNNAGYGLVGALEELSEEEYRHQIETNLFGPIKVIRAALPRMRAQRSGHIINISSAAGLRGTAGMSAYHTAKFALEGLSESLFHELQPLGIHVTVVSPGQMRTAWAGAGLKRSAVLLEAYESARLVHQRMGELDGKQLGDPARFAAAVLAVVDAAEPPMRIVLGSAAVALLEARMAADVETLHACREVALSTDVAR